ncbi:hypothetical protein FQ488_08915 [Enterococcus hirae]|uniref:hypothetical protein n=1 Tax=Enterococcus hirae TaxID=1354 RepID=UPI001861239C|nr:hypothetical protein [Enterococcus hirae]QNG05804.1 hypothetical protein FQ488_08915 [Enterococcus hirae]
MSKALKWLEAEADRLEKEYIENDDSNKTVNHSFIEGFNYALVNLQAIEELKLNDNQKIVLEWLKNEISENDLQYTLWSFTEDVYEKLEIGAGSLSYVEAWEKLKEKQKFEVLAAFAQWGSEQEKTE